MRLDSKAPVAGGVRLKSWFCFFPGWRRNPIPDGGVSIRLGSVEIKEFFHAQDGSAAFAFESVGDKVEKRLVVDFDAGVVLFGLIVEIKLCVAGNLAAFGVSRKHGY